MIRVERCVYKITISEHLFAVYMDKKQFMILVYDMLKLQNAETTIGEFRRVVQRVIQEEDE